MERQLGSTAAMGIEAQGGTTFTCYSQGCKAELTVEYDASLSQLRLRTRNGACVWSSDWLALSSQLPTGGTEQLIRAALRRWPLRIGSLLRGQKSTLTPLELAVWSIATFEDLLA